MNQHVDLGDRVSRTKHVDLGDRSVTFRHIVVGDRSVTYRHKRINEDEGAECHVPHKRNKDNES